MFVVDVTDIVHRIWVVRELGKRSMLNEAME